MSLLFKHLRIHQIFGANTNVGKTILSTALAKSSAGSVHYLKPLSTGSIEEADDKHVERYAAGVKAHCLYQLQHPVSPHLAAKLNTDPRFQVPSDDTFIKSVAGYIRSTASESSEGCMYIETAGGVHSPTLQGTTQVECYRPLFLPTILIGDAKLGGISSTIASFESLLLRGYIVDSILLFRDDHYRNWEYLKDYFARKHRDVRVDAVDPPPPVISDGQQNYLATEAYYNSFRKNENNSLHDVVAHLDECHTSRLTQLDSMARRTLDSIWWPFVQHGKITNENQVTTIDSASGDFFSVYTNGQQNNSAKSSLLAPQFDSSASWWTQAIGHAHPQLALAAGRAAGRYGHVMFPECIHQEALVLAETLLGVNKKDAPAPGKGWASRVFFSDNGSTGMEVAIKMALRAFSSSPNLPPIKDKTRLGVLGLKGSYHGDTIGAMDACDAAGVFTCEWHDAKGFWFNPPRVVIAGRKVRVKVPEAIGGGLEMEMTSGFQEVYDVSKRLDSKLAQTYKDYIQKTLQTLDNSVTLAALIIEPLIMGAGGMIFVDPLFQRVLIDVARSQPTPLPVIFDEVFIGLYRAGVPSSSPLLGVYPDISVHAKILTGGLVPLAVTLTTEKIFENFNGWDKEKGHALLHGHSYTAHAIGCAVANETLAIVGKLAGSEEWAAARENWNSKENNAVWSFWDPAFVNALSCLDAVEEVMTLGTVLAVTIKDASGGYTSNTAAQVLESIKRPLHDDGVLSSAPGGAPFGIHFRTLGNVVYFMTSFNTSEETIREVEDRVWTVLSKSVNK